MDTEYNKENILKILTDQTYYIEESVEPDKTNLNKIRRLINDYQVPFIHKEKDYLRNPITKESNYYGLLKIYKSSEIERDNRNTNR